MDVLRGHAGDWCNRRRCTRQERMEIDVLLWWPLMGTADRRYDSQERRIQIFNTEIKVLFQKRKNTQIESRISRSHRSIVDIKKLHSCMKCSSFCRCWMRSVLPTVPRWNTIGLPQRLLLSKLSLCAAALTRSMRKQPCTESTQRLLYALLTVQRGLNHRNMNLQAAFCCSLLAILRLPVFMIVDRLI